MNPFQRLSKLVPLELLDNIQKIGVIAGGAIVYELCDFVTEIGDIDIFVQSIDDFYRVEKLIRSYFFDEKITAMIFENKTSVLNIGKFQIIIQQFKTNSKKHYADRIIGTFDLDYVQCAIHNNKLYITDRAKTAHKTRRIRFIGHTSIRYHRFLKALKKGFSCPVLGRKSLDITTERFDTIEELISTYKLNDFGLNEYAENIAENDNWYDLDTLELKGIDFFIRFIFNIQDENSKKIQLIVPNIGINLYIKNINDLTYRPKDQPYWFKPFAFVDVKNQMFDSITCKNFKIIDKLKEYTGNIQIEDEKNSEIECKKIFCIIGINFYASHKNSHNIQLISCNITEVPQFDLMNSDIKKQKLEILSQMRKDQNSFFNKNYLPCDIYKLIYSDILFTSSLIELDIGCYVNINRLKYVDVDIIKWCKPVIPQIHDEIQCNALKCFVYEFEKTSDLEASIQKTLFQYNCDRNKQSVYPKFHSSLNFLMNQQKTNDIKTFHEMISYIMLK